MMRLNDRHDGSIKTLLILVLIGANLAFGLPNDTRGPWLPGLIMARAGLLIGTIIGLIVALLSTSLLRSALYATSALDLTTFLLVTLTLSIVAFFASYIPAPRATRADPMIALGRG